MSEPVRQSDSIPSKEARTSEQAFSLPTILRGAAYISSGGRIYRLFSEGDETSLQLASFGELFRFDPLPELQPLEELASLPIEIQPVTSLEKIESFPELQPLENLSLPAEIQENPSVDFLSETQLKKSENSFKTVFAKNEIVTEIVKSGKTPPILSVKHHPLITESLEPVSTPKKDLVSTVTTISTTTKNVQRISNAKVSAPPLKTVSTLELFETSPKTADVSTISEQKSLPQLKSPTVPFPQAPHSIALKNSNDVLNKKNEKTTVAAETPVVQIIRLEIHHPRKPKLPFAVRDLPLPQREKHELPENQPSNLTESKIELISEQEELIAEQAAAPVVVRKEIYTESVKNDDTNKNIVTKLSETEIITAGTVVTEQVVTETHIDESVVDKIIAKNKRSITEKVNLPIAESTEYQKVSEELESTEENDDTIFTESMSPIKQIEVNGVTASSYESNTLIFPQQKSSSFFTASSNSLQESHRTWKLDWQPHWPEHLKSLELEASDQICFLADHLEMLHERGSKVINFNGFRPGDGCTTLALCAARELAERGYRLLLADAHQRNPELPQLLRLKTDPHLYEIITLIQDHLELLPWTETAIEIASPSVLYTQSFAEIVGSFRDDYDFILLDNGSLIEYPLAERVVHWREMSSDGVLLVLNMKDPARISVRDIAQRFRQYNVELLGIAENYV